MENQTCLFCAMPNDKTHDQMVCNAIRAVLAQCLKRAEERKAA